MYGGIPPPTVFTALQYGKIRSHRTYRLTFSDDTIYYPHSAQSSCKHIENKTRTKKLIYAITYWSLKCSWKGLHKRLALTLPTKGTPVCRKWTIIISKPLKITRKYQMISIINLNITFYILFDNCEFRYAPQSPPPTRSKVITLINLS